MKTATERNRGSIAEVVAYFLRLGLLGFGGPVALVGQMERELVAERGWLSKDEMRESIAMPVAARPAGDPGRHLHFLSARRLLGRVGGAAGPSSSPTS